MEYFIGIDVGTSSTKAVLLDGEGRIVSRHSVQNALLNPQPGFFEVDALGSWWNGLLEILSFFQPYVSSVKALCISSICGSFVPVDENLEPTYHAIMYGIDTRSVDQIAKMNAELGEEYLQKHLAGPFTTQSVLPKFLWLKEKEPEVYARTAHFVESNNFLSSRLTGITRWDCSTAFAAKLADKETDDIPYEIVKRFGLDASKIPSLGWAVEELGTVTKEASLLTGLSEEAVVYTGACDVNAEAMSMLTVFPGDTMAVFGSTISMLHMMDHFIPLSGFVNGWSVLKGTYRFGVGASSGGLFLKEMDELLGFAARPEGAPKLPTGLLVSPYVHGARTPLNDPSRKATIHGINGETRRSDFYWALREAIGYEILLLVTRMESTGEVVSDIHASGGITNDPIVMQMSANITGKRILVHSGVDASYGDAIIALHGHLDWDDIRALPGFQEQNAKVVVYEPEEKVSALYRPLGKAFLSMVEERQI